MLRIILPTGDSTKMIKKFDMMQHTPMTGTFEQRVDGVLHSIESQINEIIAKYNELEEISTLAIKKHAEVIDKLRKQVQEMDLVIAAQNTEMAYIRSKINAL